MLLPCFREEGDFTFVMFCAIIYKFQSPPSVRKATLLFFVLGGLGTFQSPPSVRKATQHLMVYPVEIFYFNPRLP